MMAVANHSKRTTLSRRAAVLILGLLAQGCGLLSPTRNSRDPVRFSGKARWSLEKNLERIRSSDAEKRYLSLLDLAVSRDKRARSTLQRMLHSKEPMSRNAAARALCEQGDERATTTLIDNLDCRRPLPVTMDAIYHLRTLYGTDLGYNPLLGYRSQEEKQASWWRWWHERGGARAPTRTAPDDPASAQRRARLEERLKALEAAFPLGGCDSEKYYECARALRAGLAPIAASRDPRDLEILEQTFAFLVSRCPERRELWSAHALAALNNGHPLEAERSFRRALMLAPREASLHKHLGIVLQALERLPEAEAELRRALQLDPRDDTAAALLGGVLAAQGRDQEAIASYQRSAELSPEKWTEHRLWLGRLKRRAGPAKAPAKASR